MQLSTYVDAVHDGVTSAASLADDHTRQIAGRLADAVDSSTRLALIRALSDAAAEISTELAPGSVQVRVTDGEPTFVVDQPRERAEATILTAPAAPQGEADDDQSEPEGDADEPTARISLRLPVSVKEKVDRAADEAGVSTNTWLTQAVLSHLAMTKGQAAWTRGLGQVAQLAEAGGVFGRHGVFGPHGPFGEAGPHRGPRPPKAPKPPKPGRFPGEDGPHSDGGRVQGWVR